MEEGKKQEALDESRASNSENEVLESIPQIVVIEKYLNDHFDFRYNEVLTRIEFKSKRVTDFSLMNEFALNSIYRAMLKAKINTTIGALKSLLNSNFAPFYNPFQTYLNSLPKYAGTEDYIENLAKIVQTTNQDFWLKCFKKWFVALVASLIKNDVVNHTVIVFSGGQGLGKTTFMLSLVPECLSNYVFSGTINPNNKDTLIQLSECILINMDELENMNRSEIGSLKELITKSSIRVRKAYGVYSESYVRRASFCGSVNGKEFLSDTSGNRRFLCFEVQKIDYLQDINLNLVYAQALHLVKSDYKFWFDKEEIEELNASNHSFMTTSYEEEILLKYFRPIEVEKTKIFLSATEISKFVQQYESFQINTAFVNNIGKALVKNSFIRTKKAGRYVYAIEKVANTVEIKEQQIFKN